MADFSEAKHIAIVRELLIYEYKCEYCSIWLVPDYYDEDLDGEIYDLDPNARKVIDKIPTKNAEEACKRLSDFFNELGYTTETISSSDI